MKHVGKKHFREILAIVLSTCFILNAVCSVYAQDTVEWSVYYASGGGNGESKVVELPYYSGGYIAKCTSVSGTCTSIKTTVTAYRAFSPYEQLTLSKSVVFTKEATSYFVITTPIAGNVSFHFTMAHSGGSSAFMSGTISMDTRVN